MFAFCVHHRREFGLHDGLSFMLQRAMCQQLGPSGRSYACKVWGFRPKWGLAMTAREQVAQFRMLTWRLVT